MIDKQNSQIVWETILQGSIPTVKVIGFSYSPSPIKAYSYQTVTFNAFVIYNQNNKVLPKVNLTIVRVKSLNLSYSSPMTFTGNTVLNLNAGVYTVYVNATVNNKSSSYRSVINVVPGSSPYILDVTSIEVSQNLNHYKSPTVGHDWVSVTVNSTLPYNATFQLYYYVTFNGTTTLMNVTSNFKISTIAPFNSTVISGLWKDVKEDNYTITVNISLLSYSPLPVTVQGLSTNITVLPKNPSG